MIVRVKEGLGPFKFSGRKLVLRPGDNSVEPDQKLLVLLKRGAARGKWQLDPRDAEPAPEPEPEEAPETEPSPTAEPEPAKKTSKKKTKTKR